MACCVVLLLLGSALASALRTPVLPYADFVGSERDDVRNFVVAECPENQFEAAAAFGTCRSQPEKLEAANVQSGQNVQFFIKGVGGAQTQVVTGGRHIALGLVAGIKDMDVSWKVRVPDCVFVVRSMNTDMYMYTYTYTYIYKYMYIYKYIHFYMCVCTCMCVYVCVFVIFFLCVAVSCRVPRVLGCWLGGWVVGWLGVVWCGVVIMSLSWWSVSLVLPDSYDEFFATGKSGAFND